MKIVLNDRSESQDLGSRRIYIHSLSHWWRELGHQVTTFDDNYGAHDVALFGKGTSKKEILAARAKNASLVVGMIHPNDFEDRLGSISACDFLLVGAILEQDRYRRLCDSVFLLPQIEVLFKRQEEHRDDGPVVIGYHGNKDHLEHLSDELIAALEDLSGQRPVVLRAIYDHGKLGIWERKRPRIAIEDVQWELDSIEDQLLGCDIGLCPGLTDIPDRDRSLFFKWLRFRKPAAVTYDNDYLIRFKNTTNTGRAFVFHQLGIPVVSDICPPSFHILGHPDCGYLAHSREGWLFALRRLCDSAEHRQFLADNALREFQRLYDPLAWARRLYCDIESVFRERRQNIPQTS